MTGNEEKVKEGREKKAGEMVYAEQRDRDLGRESEEHPGMSFTKSGAMRQRCFVRPPPSTDPDEGPDDQDTVAEVTDQARSLPKDVTASIHQHADYAGPNLTAPPPVHYSPEPESEASASDPERKGLRHGMKPDSPVDVGNRLGAYDLHGGFPTGAPSPGARARGAEVVDPFERLGQAGARTVGMRSD